MNIRTFGTAAIAALAITVGVAAQQSGQSADAADKATASQYKDKDALALQVTLDNAGFSPGIIDGKLGRNTLRALEAYEGAHGKKAQPAANGGLRTHTLTKDDVAGPFTKLPADMMARAELKALSYESALEKVSEKFHVHPELLQRLNPGKAIKAGVTLKVPAVEPWDPSATATAPTVNGEVTVIVSKTKSALQVLGPDGAVIFRAPVTTGSENDPLPIGTWAVNVVARNPVFHYNPDLFWDANPEHAKAKIAPGPNNPVGVVWIDLTKEHYGIHGTPSPDKIGYAESHGCIRLTNWDAMRVAALVSKGTTVRLVE